MSENPLPRIPIPSRLAAAALLLWGMRRGHARRHLELIRTVLFNPTAFVSAEYAITDTSPPTWRRGRSILVALTLAALVLGPGSLLCVGQVARAQGGAVVDELIVEHRPFQPRAVPYDPDRSLRDNWEAASGWRPLEAAAVAPENCDVRAQLPGGDEPCLKLTLASPPEAPGWLRVIYQKDGKLMSYGVAYYAVPEPRMTTGVLAGLGALWIGATSRRPTP